MRRHLIPITVLLAAVLTLSCGQTEEDRAVREMIREAEEFLRMADRERETRVTEAEYLERQALERLEEAIFRYPESQQTLRLVEDRVSVGPYTLTELRARVAEQEERAREVPEEVRVAEEDPLIRAGDLAGRPGTPYFQAGLLARIAAAHSRRGETPLADEFFFRAREAAESVQAPYYQVLALSELAGQYLEAGREEEAGDFLLRAQELTEEIAFPFFRSGAAAVTASRYLESGQEEEAFEIVEMIVEPYYRAWILLRAAGHFLDQGREDEASELLEQARPDALRVEDPEFRVEVITDYAGRAAQLGKPGASELLDEAYREALNLPATAPRAGALNRVASWLALLDRREEAEEILETAAAEAGRIEDNLFKDLVLLEIVECVAGWGDYDRAEEIIDLIDEPRFQGLSLAAIAQHCQEAGEEELAEAYANQAREALAEVENPHFRADILIRIAGSLSPGLPSPQLPEVGPPDPEE